MHITVQMSSKNICRLLELGLLAAYEVKWEVDAGAITAVVATL